MRRRAPILTLAPASFGLGLCLAFTAAGCDRGAAGLRSDQLQGQGPSAAGTGTSGGASVASSSSAALLQADTLLLQGRTDEAIQLAQGVLAVEPDSAAAHRVLGQVFAARDDMASATTHLERALQLDPEDGRTLSILADTKGRGGDPAAAIDLYGRYLERSPDDLVARLALGRLLLNAARFEEAAPHVEAAAQRPSAGAFTALGRLRSAQGRGEEAETALRRAIEIDRLDAEALLALGRHLVESGREVEGRAVMEHQADVTAAMDQIRFYENSSSMAGASSGNFVLVGQAWLAAGEIQKAADIFGDVVQRDPEAATAALSLAEVYVLNGEADAASQWIVHAMRTMPEDKRAHRDMALVRIVEGQADLATASIERSQRAGQWDVEDHRLVGKAYLQADQITDAQANFAAALALAPEDVELIVLDGIARLPDDPAAAATAFERARELRPYGAGPALAHGVALHLLDDPAAGDAAFADALARRVPGDGILVGLEAVRGWLADRPGTRRPLARFDELEAAASTAASPDDSTTTSTSISPSP